MDYFKEYFAYAGVGNSEAPTIYHRWTAISIIGTMLGRNVWIPFGHSRIYPNQYIMLMGAPGTRKSTAIGIGKSLLSEIGFSRFASDRTSKERFLIDMQTMDEDLEEDELLNLMLDAPSELYVVAEEFTDFVGHNNMEFLTMLTKLWDNMDSYKHPKIHGKSIEVIKPTVNILAGNTAQGFSLAFPAEALGNGFLSRMLLVHADSNGTKITFPKPRDEVLKQLLADHLNQIKTICMGEFKIEEEAYKTFDDIYKSFTDLEDYRFKHYCSRRLTHLIKISTILACTNLRTEISKADVLQANTLLHYTENRMPKALGEFGKSKLSDQTNMVMDLLNEATKPLTLENILKKIGREFSKIVELGDVIRNLQAAGKVQQVQLLGKVAYLPLKEEKKTCKPELLDESFLTEEEKML